jgi:hypothetical protein
MIVVSDASPITSLLQVGHCELLRSLFGEVLIPPAVNVELRRFHETLPTFVQVREVRDKQVIEALETLLDRGEAEAIALASELGADYVLVDETLGRAAAERKNLTVIGLLGVLLLAKKARMLPSVATLIAELETKAGFYVSKPVRDVILKAAGES